MLPKGAERGGGRRRFGDNVRWEARRADAFVVAGKNRRSKKAGLNPIRRPMPSLAQILARARAQEKQRRSRRPWFDAPRCGRQCSLTTGRLQPPWRVKSAGSASCLRGGWIGSLRFVANVRNPMRFSVSGMQLCGPCRFAMRPERRGLGGIVDPSAEP